MKPRPNHGSDSNPRHLRTRMVALLEKLAPTEGYNLTALPDVRFLRSNRPLRSTPVLYDPGIVIVCQGRKRGFFGDEVYVYDEQHYLAVSVPVPFTMETDATEHAPLLAIYMHLDFKLAADLMLQIDQSGSAEPPAEPKGMMSTPMDGRLGESVLRLLEAMARPLEAEVLGPALVREIYFRILTGDQGPSMRAALGMQGHFGKVARALRRIHASFNVDLDVAQLAREARMSVPTFHAHFKAVTNTSPMQYLKSTRLHQARLLMVRNGMTAAAASAEVGYDSPSQFSREFKRLFGRSPMAEVKRMRDDFAVPPAHACAVYVSSH
ncbi:AraC family transcriptional regulator [Trinickia caryophylli]|uniref:Transcriptional regulator, AraC family n=1 Tax=Trinickia caryophylli TaxID=28094 RepID=A0A1X7DLD5_TRICW|nr:AraC family transcriptional regulator [Trinickia caryophylli]PMS10684.1 AraC family transcriptional regulator [Trinickia caryophylli]TRX17130.1 AraC family transcriptional regulator [Trinickia caryophylli]WQE12134.1 AraC family transcriptional regulator [Trinickia caryophylli]SMF17661.1 transcriptional regulator, AraC family [Trinickia caryophylli]GLU31735.1 transcriptional regulator [Trinickia caryophylli]